MERCSRCGHESSDLRAFRMGGNAKREKLCEPCHAEAKENHGLTPEEIAAENARWDRIFRNFVDPTYYTPTIPTLQSSFGAFASEMEVAYRG